MNNEIKEILEELKEKNETYKECNENGIIENEYYKSHLLLNYITNLQEENKQLKKHHICIRSYTNDEVREKIDNYKDIIKQLQQENERLRQQNFNLIEYRDSLIDENREQQEDLFDCKLRIDKAIEYLEEPNRDNFDYSKAILLDILDSEE